MTKPSSQPSGRRGRATVSGALARTQDPAGGRQAFKRSEDTASAFGVEPYPAAAQNAS
jgi:hypothetical protein